MTIVELVVAFAILMVVLVPIAMLLSNVIGQAATSRERLTALSIAEQYVDLLNNTPLNGTRNETPNVHTLPVVSKTLQQTTTPLVRSTVAYSVFARFTWAVHQAPAATPATRLDLCTSGAAPTLLTLRVTVKWPRRATQQITDTTMIDYPPSGIVTNGFIAIKVEGDPASKPPADAGGHPWATRVKAVPVTISPEPTVTGFTTITRQPNQFGCVFEEVPPGKYAVSVADPSPGVPAGTHYGTPSWAANNNEQLSETTPTPASVTVGNVTTVAFQYDEGSLVTLDYPSTTVAEGDVTCPGAGTILCMATGQSPTSATAPAGTARADLAVLTKKTGWSVYQPAATRLVDTACAGTTRCITVGYRTTGSSSVGASVSATTGTQVTFSSDTVPPGVLALRGIQCPTATTCDAYGEGATASSAAILSATVGSGALTWTLDAGLAGVAQISSLACTPTTCVATGTSTSNGPVVLSLAATGSSWTTDALPATAAPKAVTSVTGAGCRARACFVLGTDGAGAVILSQKAAKPTTWMEDAIPATSQLSAITCPAAASCYAEGTASGAPEVLSITSSTATTVTWKQDTLPTGLTTLSALTCPGATSCEATGGRATGPAVLSLSSASSWASDTLPKTLGSVTDLTCATATACTATSTTTVGGRVTAVVVARSTTSAWKVEPLPAGVAPVYLAGAGCTPSGATCAAAGATDTGAVFLSGTPHGTTAWAGKAPSNVTGLYLADTPISVYNAGLSPSSTLEVASPSPATGDVSAIGPLFPFASGYEVAAAGCATQLTATAANVTSVPGGSATARLAMGLLPVEVRSATGTPVAGASVSVQLNCGRLAPPAGSATQATFSLESTGALGLSETSVMYGSYTVTVSAGGTTATLTVTVSETGTKVNGVTTPLPAPVVVTL